jgi:ribosomal protein S18 acetylase RimI-like enzyme
MTFQIVPAVSSEDIADARGLFREYIAGLGIDLSFQNVDAELAGLPGVYAPPDGALLIARGASREAVGCVAMRPASDGVSGEMKRLYTRPAARGSGLGRHLAEAVIEHARLRRYDRIVLDTLASMEAAHRLYASLGFVQIDAYYSNPVPGTRYMALALR